MKVPRQPAINIGLVGHVDHGKTTLVKVLSGEWTDRHSEEVRRGISIRLGYADAAFYRCPNCPEPSCFTVAPVCPICGSDTHLERVVSFVDSPGHEALMATMLSGAAIMDGTLLIIAANEPCPQPQTKEHRMALQIMGIKNVVVVQNKVDLVSEEEAMQNYHEIRAFLQDDAIPIIPTSAQQGTNMDVLIQAIEQHLPTPTRDPEKTSRMYVARSFDINTPGTRPHDLRGGVLGGSLSQGVLHVGDDVEIKPGIKGELVTKVSSLMSGGNSLKKAGPGGLIAIGTKLDPALTKSDAMAGRVTGKPGMLPPLREALSMDIHLLPHAVGAPQEVAVGRLTIGETLMLSVGTATTVGIVRQANDLVECDLKISVCAEVGQRVAIGRRIGSRWRLIGYGVTQ